MPALLGEEIDEDVLQTDSEMEEPPSEPERTDEFTTLDRRLVRVVIDSMQGVEGALEPDELDDLLEEVVALSGVRHQSYFHLGFADTLRDRPIRDSLPAENEARQDWYLAGVVNALGRLGRHEKITALFDAREELRRLGARGTGAGSTAGRLIFLALCRAGRHGEAAGFLSVEALVHGPRLAHEVLEQARTLLNADRAAEARGLVERLGELVARLEAEGFETADRFFLEIRRRRAHCYRQLGDRGRARELLERLETEESDQNIQAMVATDLGLVDGGFRSLTDLVLPDRPDALASFLEAVGRGEDQFRKSVDFGVRYSAHGHYCLGVLDLGRRAWDRAATALELALSVFESEVQHYGRTRLVAQARLYCGLALCIGLDPLRIGRATQLIASGLDDGCRIPSYLLADVLGALAVFEDDEAAERLVAVLIERDPEVLTQAAETDLLTNARAVPEALVRRAADESRPREARAGDLRLALPGLIRAGAREEAAQVLDELEVLAREGFGDSELLALLDSPPAYDPAWGPEEAAWARINLLQARGRPVEAAALIEQDFWRVLHSGNHGAHAEASEMIDLYRSLGGSPEQVERLRAALGADDSEETPRPPTHPQGVTKVLFVGGDERQSAAQDYLREKLRERRPHARVEFEHPGWSSNWGGKLDDIVGRLDQFRAVVIMRFTRTEFGRRLRASLGIPWVHCAGPGRQTMLASIIQAVDIADRA
jgi:tetratricopeptide (TPR) repeat protein